jgi:hypothetical protein
MVIPLVICQGTKRPFVGWAGSGLPIGIVVISAYKPAAHAKNPEGPANSCPSEAKNVVFTAYCQTLPQPFPAQFRPNVAISA